MSIATMMRPVAALALIAVALCPAAAQQPDSAVTQLLNRGYAFRRAGQNDSAAKVFSLALDRDSSNVRVARELAFAQIAAGDTLGARTTFRHIVRIALGTRDDQAQLGYLDLTLHDLPGAIQAFEGATHAAPSDGPLHLQLAYAYESVGNHVAALHAFEDAARVGDATVVRQARASMVVLAGSWYASPGTVIADWYASAQYGTRFNDLIISPQAHVALALDAPSRTQAYIVGRAVRDSRTRGGVQPVIFSDNYAGVAAGIRSRPFTPNITLYAEGGPTTTLTGGGKSGLDWRAGMNFGSEWRSTHTRWYNQSYVDASYYGRYDDAIAYAQLRQLRPLSGAASWLDASIREGLTADGRGVSYNNLAEGAVGLRVHGGPDAVGALYLEYVQGLYTRNRVENRRTFGELRATFVASGSATRLRR